MAKQNLPIEQIYSIRFHESTHTDALPYHLDIIPFFPDERFAYYLQDICYNKRIVIYIFIDRFIEKLSVIGMNPKRFYIDRVENILKTFKNQYISENDIIDVDLTSHLTFRFGTKKERVYFQKQFENSANRIILYEYKNYVKILKELNITPTFHTVNHNNTIEAAPQKSVDDNMPYVKEVKESPLFLENNTNKSKWNPFK